MYSRDYRRSKEKCRLVKLPVQDSAPKIQVIHFPWFSRLFFPLCWFSFINKYHLWNSLEPTHSRKKKCLFLFLKICAQGKNWTVLLLVFFKVHPLHSKHISAQYSTFSPIKLCSFWFYSSNNQKSLKMQASDLKLTHNIWIHILD